MWTVWGVSPRCLGNPVQDSMETRPNIVFHFPDRGTYPSGSRRCSPCPTHLTPQRIPTAAKSDSLADSGASSRFFYPDGSSSPARCRSGTGSAPNRGSRHACAAQTPQWSASCWPRWSIRCRSRASGAWPISRSRAPHSSSSNGCACRPCSWSRWWWAPASWQRSDKRGVEEKPPPSAANKALAASQFRTNLRP